MMSANVLLRPLTASDGPAFAGLSYSSSDGGVINYAANYMVDAFEAVKALHGEMDGVAATGRDGSRLTGVALVRYGQCQYESETHPFALISNLIVHPDFRGQGLAAQMVDWLIEKARARLGEAGVIVANLQHGNLASHKVFSRWLDKVAGPLAYLPLPTRLDAPITPSGLSIGPLAENEFEPFAEHLNTFYQHFNFHQPTTADCLAMLHERTPLSSPFRHPYTVVDAKGNLLAGLLVMEEYRLKQLEIRGLPAAIRAIDRIFHVIPPDSTIRGIYLDHLWFQPGQAQAARHLIETVRWIWSNRATNVSVYIDPRSPLNELFPKRPWSIVVRSQLAVGGPRELDTRRFVCPIY